MDTDENTRKQGKFTALRIDAWKRKVHKAQGIHRKVEDENHGGASSGQSTARGESQG